MDPLENAAAPTTAKPKTKRKPPKKKAKRPAKSKHKPKAKKRVKAKRPARKVKAPKRKAAKTGNVVRSERLDMRLSKAEKAKVSAKAKKTRRTITSLIIEAVEKIR